jgi:hypothetical protein
LVKLALAEQGYTSEVPVRVKHMWKPIRASDVYDMANAVAALYANGLGILADYPEIGFDMMGWDKKVLQEKQSPTSPPAPRTQPKPGAPKGPLLPGVETVEPGQT